MTAWTRDTPWRQGHLLPAEAVQLLPDAKDWPQNGQVIVASHDCDIAQSPEREPMLEVVVGRSIVKLDGNCTNAKNARQLHVKFGGPRDLLVEFLAKDKRYIHKELLCGIQPNAEFCLSKESKNVFEVWLASRYRRSAFPDEFEDRLKQSGLSEHLTNAVRPSGEHIEKVLFDLSETQPQNGVAECYKLGIVLLFLSEPDYLTAKNAAEEAKAAIESAFEKTIKGRSIGIYIEYVEAISDQSLSYHQFNILKPWRLNYISLSSVPQQPISAT